MNEIYSIIVEDLTKNFGNFTAVNNISLTIKKGEIFGFLGANGAGKSTTIRMLAGLLAPSSGRATVAGFDIAREPEKIKANIGYMAQKFSLYSDLTVNENILFYGGIYGLSSMLIEKKKGKILELLGLKDVQNTRAQDLARGFLQRLSFACAILHDPKIIFLDEPTAGVDPIQRRNFWDLIYNLAETGITIFVTTHFLDEAEFCDRLSLIVNGKIVAMDTLSGFKSLMNMYSIYEIESVNTIEVLKIMEETEWVVSASIFGNTVHATIVKEMDGDQKIRARLFNIEINRISKVEPSLEDVFLYLAEGRN